MPRHVRGCGDDGGSGGGGSGNDGGDVSKCERMMMLMITGIGTNMASMKM